MTRTLMSPDEFSAAVPPVLDAVKIVVGAPLEDIIAYVEYCEKMGEKPDSQMTEDRAVTLRAIARIMSASIFLRETMKLGGEPLADRD